MGREVRRVPLGFDWPIDKVWTGFVLPKWLHEDPCPSCKDGYSGYAQALSDRWWGYSSFTPESNGSKPLTASTPVVRAFAERNVSQAPDFYGPGETAIVREATRLAALWNGMWMHHLTQEEVDILVAAGRLRDLTHTWVRDSGWQPIEPAPALTAEQVNTWSITSPLGLSSSDAYVLIKHYCKLANLPHLCPTCHGNASIEKWTGQTAAAEAWQRLDPPTGDAWQLWETVSEGSPISPAFPTAQQLADWMANRTPEDRWNGGSITREAALTWITRDGSAPSLVVDNTGVHTGIEYMAATNKEHA